MKKLLLFLFLISCTTQASTSSFEAIGGSITYHVIDNTGSSQYQNKLSSDGRLIFNDLLGIRYISQDSYTYWSTSAFTGSNSIDSYITGAILSYGLTNRNLYIGTVLGGYVQDDDAFRNHGIDPYRMTEFGNTGLVPIIGIEINYKIDFTSKYYLKINNILSPVILNTSLSLGRTF